MVDVMLWLIGVCFLQKAATLNWLAGCYLSKSCGGKRMPLTQDNNNLNQQSQLVKERLKLFSSCYSSTMIHWLCAYWVIRLSHIWCLWCPWFLCKAICTKKFWKVCLGSQLNHNLTEQIHLMLVTCSCYQPVCCLQPGRSFHVAFLSFHS